MKEIRWVVAILLLGGIFGCAGVSKNGLGEETIKVSFPDGWVVSNEQKTERMYILKTVPAQKSKEGKREQFVMSSLKYRKNVSGRMSAESIIARGEAICPSQKSTINETKIENGIPIVSWKSFCEKHPEKGEPTVIWGKTFEGGNSLHHIMKTWFYIPSTDEKRTWEEVFSKAKVCGSSKAEKKC